MPDNLLNSDIFLVIVGGIVFAAVIAFAVWFQMAGSFKGISMDVIRIAVYVIICIIGLFILAKSGFTKFTFSNAVSLIGLGAILIFLVLIRTSDQVFGISTKIVKVVLYFLTALVAIFIARGIL